jgi:predicted MPP superfamily phosphohydrolase
VEGNHDRRAGLQAVHNALANAGATLLKEAILITGWDVMLVSRTDRPPPGSRAILCAHDPAIFPLAARANIDLTFAGHLHGGQCVLFRRAGRFYPGAWFAKWTGLRFCLGQCILLVSRGAADTLPVRWNCPREVIVCEIT